MSLLTAGLRALSCEVRRVMSETSCDLVVHLAFQWGIWGALLQLWGGACFPPCFPVPPWPQLQATPDRDLELNPQATETHKHRCFQSGHF